MIRDVTIVDGNGGSPKRHQTVLITEGRLAKIGPAAQISATATSVVEGAGLWLIPGLIDTNVHLTFGPKIPGSLTELREETLPRIARARAQKFLQHGFTTVLDTAGDLEVLARVRAELSRHVQGPRLLIAGIVLGWGDGDICYVSSPEAGGTKGSCGSRGDEYGLSLDVLEIGLDTLGRRVAEYIRHGVDFVKIGADRHASPSWPVFTQAQLETIVEVAHAHGIPVTAHCIYPEVMRGCMRAGVDWLVHFNFVGGEGIPDEVFEIMSRRRVGCSIQTSQLSKASLERLLRHVDIPEGAKQGMRARLQTGRVDWNDHIRRAHEAGCILSIESDKWLPTSTYFQAMEVLVKEAGLTPLEAITAATKNGAILAGVDESTGTIEEGKSADLVLLRADPTADIRNMRRIELVIRSGAVVPNSRHHDGSPFVLAGPFDDEVTADEPSI